MSAFATDAEWIPAEVEKLARSLPPAGAVALIGCRAGESSSVSLDCCEYDLAVFSGERSDSQVIRLKDQTVELLYFDGQPASSIADLYGMKIIRDSNKFTLASSASEMSQGKFRKAISASGRKLLVSSLFCLRRAAEQSEKGGTVLAPMWAKIAAYRFMSGAIALSGSRPMPLHEIGQSRQIEAAGHVADGIQAALECIGTERATRPAISRSLEALRELKSKDYDRDLVMSKIDILLDRQMLSDCYYYIGRTAAENLAKRNESFYRRYAKLVQLGLDLTSDAQHVEKLQRTISRAANAILKE